MKKKKNEIEIEMNSRHFKITQEFLKIILIPITL